MNGYRYRGLQPAPSPGAGEQLGMGLATALPGFLEKILGTVQEKRKAKYERDLLQRIFEEAGIIPASKETIRGEGMMERKQRLLPAQVREAETKKPGMLRKLFDPDLPYTGTSPLTGALGLKALGSIFTKPTHPTSFREFELAGGEKGTGMTYADLLAKRREPATPRESPEEKRKHEFRTWLADVMASDQTVEWLGHAERVSPEEAWAKYNETKDELEEPDIVRAGLILLHGSPPRAISTPKRIPVERKPSALGNIRSILDLLKSGRELITR